MSWFARIIAHHPWVVVIAVAVFASTCVLIPLTTIRLPNFKDPQMGFETRGTEIAQRLKAWNNLIDATGRLLTADPSVPLNSFGKKFRSKGSVILYGTIRNETTEKEIAASKLNPYFNISLTVEPRRNYTYDDSQEDWELLKSEFSSDASHHQHDHLSPDAYFCNQPDGEYGRIVVSAKNNEDLFSYKSVQELCHLEMKLISNPHYSELCERISKNLCCKSWSLPNYIAMLSKRSSCLNITKVDVEKTRNLLEYCHHYYFDLDHMPDYKTKDIPFQCRNHNAAYNMLHFVLDFEFKNESTPLQNVMIILPIARSSAALDYYNSLGLSSLYFQNVVITAIDFGLKETLFDDYLVKDTKLIAVGAGFVLISMWVYTGSLFVTLMTLIAIAFSLGISYFIYTLIFELKFFPFMNLLASIVAVGVGGDAGLMVCKVWSCAKSEDERITMTKLVHASHNHSALCMLVSSLTTAAAFYSSYISNITAICCFSVFAGTAVVANFVVMIAWIPASLVISERLPRVISGMEPALGSVGEAFRSFLVASILRLRYFWIVSLGGLAAASAVAVLYYPRLRLPDSPDFQLFRTSHPFEQYDLVYRERFWFERLQRMDVNKASSRLPLRFVWGVMPLDNGDYMDPNSRGKLQLDPSFDLSAPESQKWLLSFCSNLRAQPFYQSTLGPLLPNCFLESFVGWMERRCSDPVHSSLSRAPCCETAKFPYSKRVFSTCLPKAAASLYSTPAELSMPGVAGPKFSVLPSKSGLPKLKALVVEYDSSYSHTTSFIEMDRFYNQVESWSKSELKKAPAGMRNGWFVSQLELYDLQRSLQKDTVVAIAVSVGVAFLVVLLTTLNPLLSLCAIVTITATIFVTVATLIFLGWKLNVLEAVAVSVAIGLAVDFSIHYVVNYKMAPDKEKRENAVVYSVSMMGGPTLMAALTTSVTGALMLPSEVLAYTQIGVFLIVVMSASWLYSTMFLMSVLAVGGPEGRSIGLGASSWWWWRRRSGRSSGHSRQGNQPREQHELVARRRRRRAPLPADRSPSAASATTIIHDDDVISPSSATVPELVALTVPPLHND